jgi:UDP-glucose 4-epimerase
MVIPRLVDEAVAGRDLTVYGDGQQTRCFCHVEDVVRALLGLLEDERAEGDVFNIGSTEEVSIADLGRKIIAAAGSRSEVKLIPYDEAYEQGFEDMRRRVPDISKIRDLIGWEPKRTLDEIITEVVAETRARGGSEPDDLSKIGWRTA